MDSPQLSRQEINQLLLSLQQLENNEAFEAFKAEAQNLYDRAIETVLQTTPFDIQTFLTRERMIGAAQQLRQILDQPATMQEDLNQQLNQHNEH
jgi:hypothetical protein